jgi:hypothetical protein
MQEFYDTKFINNDAAALGYFYDPPKGWANLKDCGAFSCTAPRNTMLTFKRNSFEKGRPPYGAYDFQMIPNTPGFSEFIPKCKLQQDMNLYTCKD